MERSATRLRRGVATAAIFATTVSGCAARPGATGSSAASPPTATTVSTTVQQGAGASAVDEAVGALLDSGSYAFEIDIVLVGDQTIESTLRGWVDGPDRELRLAVGNATIVTRVIDGVATVEQDGTISEVPVQEADAAPSLGILRSLDEVVLMSPTEIMGALDASFLERAGFGTTGGADVVVYLTDAGVLAGYRIQTSNGSWTIDARFSDVGRDFG
jgi:hypothetical protein